MRFDRLRPITRKMVAQQLRLMGAGAKYPDGIPNAAVGAAAEQPRREDEDPMSYRAITEVRITLLAHGKGWLVEEGWTEYRGNDPVFVRQTGVGCSTWDSVLRRLHRHEEQKDHTLRFRPLGTRDELGWAVDAGGAK